MRIPVAANGGALLWSLGEAVLAVGLIKDYIQSMTRKAPMRYSAQVKPISFLKAHAAEVLQRLAEDREALVITQNGEAKAVLQDVASYEETQETLPCSSSWPWGSGRWRRAASGPLPPC